MEKKENRQLEILIDNVPFRVDSKKGRIIEVGNPENYIKRSDLKDEGSWYRTWYDRETKNLFEGWLQMGVPISNVIPLYIPKLLFSPQMATDQFLIARLRYECGRFNRGFNVVESKPVIQNIERPKRKAKSGSVARKKRSR